MSYMIIYQMMRDRKMSSIIQQDEAFDYVVENHTEELIEYVCENHTKELVEFACDYHLDKVISYMKDKIMGEKNDNV